MLGTRFYDETEGSSSAPTIYGAFKDYVPGKLARMPKNVTWNPADYPQRRAGRSRRWANGGGPIWAIFDAEAVKRENWMVEPPFVDHEPDSSSAALPR